MPSQSISNQPIPNPNLLTDNFSRESPVPIYRNRESIRDRLESDAWKNHPQFAASQASKHQPVSSGKSLKWQDRALLALSALLLLLLIFRVETAAAQEDQWGLEFQGGGSSQRSLALNTEMQVDVTGLVARISVSQTFRNSGRGWSEAIYRFPLPDGSAVDRMTVQVGTRVLAGEIQEKQDARRQYQQAKSSGKIATLVEQQRANQFETRLANIGPDEEITVSISFLARVDYRDGSFSLRIPMTFTPRWDRGGAPAIQSGFFNETSPVPTLTSLFGTGANSRAGQNDHYLDLNIN